MPFDNANFIARYRGMSKWLYDFIGTPTALFVLAAFAVGVSFLCFYLGVQHNG